jgi:hypothetical protein
MDVVAVAAVDMAGRPASRANDRVKALGDILVVIACAVAGTFEDGLLELIIGVVGAGSATA